MAGRRQLTLADNLHLHVRFPNGQAAAIIRAEMELEDDFALEIIDEVRTNIEERFSEGK